MDAIEIGRQRAEALYAQAVVAGHDPWKPLTFALAEVKRRDLDAESTNKGAVGLNGGRATFVQEDGLILYERGGTEFERAFLVAHEIGHIELGDDFEDAKDVAPYIIDPTRPAEASPIGMDRVMDYGRRERREVQMDLFAREFLLPRPVVRRLHIEECMTASDIAEKLGAPFEVVAQQLLDALLLPPMVTTVDDLYKERALNELQTVAAGHKGGAYLLEAGPGTGKTQTLIARLKALLTEKVDPRRILVLTFSNKAAGEIAERIARVDSAAAAAMWIGTFHAFGLDLLRRFHTEMGLPVDPRMLDRTEAVELLEQEFPRLGLKHYRNIYDPTDIITDILVAISRAKDEVVDADAYRQLAETMLTTAASEEDILAAEKTMEVAKVYKAYERLKRQTQVVDFGDLVCLPVQLLESNDVVRTMLRETYNHVLVDEYQDVNRSSVRLLSALCGEGENLWVVGDAKQAIYRFRGASSFNMDRFGIDDFPGGDRGCLKVNYRSVEEIVAAFSKFAVGMVFGGAMSELTSDRGAEGHLPELRLIEQGDAQVVAIADAVAEMRAAGYSYRDQAVLCTGNEKLSEFGRKLERLNVPVLFLGSLFERPEVKDLLGLVSLLVDRRAMGLLRTACLPDFAMTLGDVAAVMDHLKEHNFEAGNWRSTNGAINDLSVDGQSALNKLAKAFEGFGDDSVPWTVMATLLLDRTRMAAHLAQSVETADRARGIAMWQLLNFVRVQPTGRGLPITRLLDRVRRLVKLGDDRDLRKLPAAAQSIDAVQLMTIHGAKGLEFPVVHLPGMNVNTLPSAVRAPACFPPSGMVEGADGNPKELHRMEHEKEQKCLFYVALSRAKDRLFMYAATRNAAGARRAPSKFIDWLGAAVMIKSVTTSQPTPSDPEDTAIDLVIEGGLSFKGREISLYQSCQRRFFYTHVLRVGGKRISTPFMQMHDAVRTAYQVVVRSGVPAAGSLDEDLGQAFAASGLANHGYVSDYLELAKSMLGYFTSIREGHTAEPPVGLSLTFGKETIVVLPDDVLVGADGRRTFRRVQTGHKRSNDLKELDAATFLLAARNAFPDAAVEFVYLSDGAAHTVDFTPKQLADGSAKLVASLQSVRSGVFQVTRSARVCPACPAFFVCGPFPPGALRKNF
ncbi:UvrD-helicase domain-containing protein [Nitrosospira sp. Nsp1]|uniref:UvrD-helicase domain-containing protein n=1 Tax=Nitrosospira sp. Nsp1 TaxID=136547 RepID=UPI00088D782B|nr:UvrD-helicase domain-containing protein [Nitrosospira sp. Nsp1]SCX49398.1 Superfamily I DNA or RNA helicase [Nitrosospira sp. Nsp1]